MEWIVVEVAWSWSQPSPLSIHVGCQISDFKKRLALLKHIKLEAMHYVLVTKSQLIQDDSAINQINNIKCNYKKI